MTKLRPFFIAVIAGTFADRQPAAADKMRMTPRDGDEIDDGEEEGLQR